MSVLVNIIIAVCFTLFGSCIAIITRCIEDDIEAKRKAQKLAKEKELAEAENQRKLMEAILDKLNKE